MSHKAALALAAVSAFVAHSTAALGNYPEKSIRIVAPYLTGTPSDVAARLIGQKYTEAWGKSVVIENVAGASGNIGGDLSAKATPDGYTLFMTSGSIVTANQHLFKKMPFNPEKSTSKAPR